MFLHILSAASEYNELPVRHNEVFLIMCSPYLYPDYLYILIERDKFERNKLYIIYLKLCPYYLVMNLRVALLNSEKCLSCQAE